MFESATALLAALGGAVTTAAAPIILWLLRELRTDVKDIRDNHLPHIYREISNLQRAHDAPLDRPQPLDRCD